MQRVELNADHRDQTGKGAARAIRRAGMIPAVLYGEGKSSLLTLKPADLVKILKSASGENALVTVKIKGGKSAETRTAIIREYQRDPISDEILHADLFEINMNKPIRLRVHITLTGSVSAGVKEGGVLQHNMRDVEIECLPSLIPDQIEIDASDLKVGESLHVRDLQIREGVRILEDQDLPIVSVAAPMSEEKLEQILTGTPVGEVKEPEVIGKKKEEEEGEAEKGAAPETAAGGKPGEKSE